jgi:hypothetical protein
VKIGARILKTGIAVTITMYICKLFNLEPAFFGAVATVVNMQPTISLTVKSAKDQILVHMIGVSAGLIFGYMIGGSPLIMGIVSILLIVIYIRLGLNTGISMGIVAALFVMGSSQELFLPHALNRTGVIFAGLITAMTVNVLLWPPRYSRMLKERLKESNEAAVDYFCRAVDEYVKLENDTPEHDLAAKQRVHRLNAETRALSGRLASEGDLLGLGTAEQNRWRILAEKFIDYNATLTEKADHIYAILPVRLERRHQAGDPPISDEFREILMILGQGCSGIQRINGKLRSVILDGEDAQTEEISEVYWERLKVAIEQWQPKLTSSYYVHALIEAAVAADEIRWAARQGKLILQESAVGGDEE